MNSITHFFSYLFALFIPVVVSASITVGVGKRDITPPVGTPSAGYIKRNGEGMQGVHDPLLAIALFIDNGEKKNRPLQCRSFGVYL